MALFPPAAESPRLRYELVHPDRFDPYELYEHVNEDAPRIAELTRWMTWDPHDSPKVTAEFVADVGERYDEDEGVTYAIYPREGEDVAGAFAGTCGLTVEWDRRLGTLGVWFRPRFWGRGYSGERARTFAELAFEVLDLEVLAVTHDPANEKSGRAIEKYVDALGGRREGTVRNDIVIDGEPRDSVRYSITAGEYREATGETRAEFEWADD